MGDPRPYRDSPPPVPPLEILLNVNWNSPPLPPPVPPPSPLLIEDSPMEDIWHPEINLYASSPPLSLQGSPEATVDPLLALLAEPLDVQGDIIQDIVEPISCPSPVAGPSSEPIRHTCTPGTVTVSHDRGVTQDGVGPSRLLNSLFHSNTIRDTNVKTIGSRSPELKNRAWKKAFGLSRLAPGLNWSVDAMRRSHSSPSLLFHPSFPRPSPQEDPHSTKGMTWSKALVNVHGMTAEGNLEPMVVSKPNLILGDEFLGGLPRVYRAEVQVDIYPQATLADGLTILTTLPRSSHQVKKVILHFGLNTIHRETPMATRARIWDLFWMGTMKFPEATIYLPLLHFPLGIEEPIRSLLYLSNDCFVELGSFIPRAIEDYMMQPLERYDWLPKTSWRVWSLWKLYLED